MLCVFFCLVFLVIPYLLLLTCLVQFVPQDESLEDPQLPATVFQCGYGTAAVHRSINMHYTYTACTPVDDGSGCRKCRTIFSDTKYLKSISHETTQLGFSGK